MPIKKKKPKKIIRKSAARKVREKPSVLASPLFSAPITQLPPAEKAEAPASVFAEKKAPPKPSWNLRVFRWKTKFANIAKKEIILFPKSNLPISFKPFLAVQGLAVFLLFVTIASFLIPQNKLNEALVIKSSSATTKQNTIAIAQGNPVQWTTLVKRSDITLGKAGKYLLKLPKGATNIKITTISKNQAETVLKAKPKEQLSLSQRQQIASQTQTQTQKNQSFIARIAGYLFAELDGAVENVVEAITGTDTEQEQAVIETEDAVVVDLSAQAETPAEETPSPSPTPASTESFGEATPEITPIPIETPNSTVDSPSPEATAEQSQSTVLPSLIETTSPSDAPVVGGTSDVPPTPTPEATLNPDDEDVVQVTYETEAPTITEQATDTGKTVTVSSATEDPATPLTDVLAFTNIPEIYKVGQESKIKIRWKNGPSTGSGHETEMQFRAYDKDNNGKLDYVEWTVPHLSEQIFEIIFISKAFQLDSNQNIVADIYDTVKTQDGNYASIPDGNYVRATFEQVLNNTKDITVYAKPADVGRLPSIEVYPVYTDADGNQTEGPKLDLVNDGTNPDFSNIDHDGKYRVLLTNLATPTDVFDLRVTGGDADVDYIVDPAATSITISTGADTCSGCWDGGSPTNTYTSTSGGADTINNATLATKLAAGNVVINPTTGDITVSNVITKSSGGDVTLAMYADGNIIVNAAISATVGELNVLLNADRDANSSGYINILGAITSNGGNITMGGGSGTISAGTGFAVGNSGQAAGVYINNVAVAAGGGNIIVNGQGYNTTTNANYGVYVYNASGAITTTGSGTINITANGAGAGDSGSNYGLENNGTISTANGNLTITATGGGAGTSSENHGVDVDGTIQTTGSGALSITGTAGAGSGGNSYGVYVTGGLVSCAGGAMTITGTGGSGGSHSEGVDVLAGVISNTGSGTINIIGTGGAGAGGVGYNFGFDAEGGSVSTVNGNLTVTATGGGVDSSVNNYGVYVTSNTGSAVTTTGSGALSVTGIRGGGNTTSNYGVNVAIANGLRTTGTGTITVSTDTLLLAQANDIKSAGSLTIAPYTASGTVGVAGGAGTLALSTTYLGYLTYASLQIGNSAQTGATTVNAYASWAKPISFATNASGSISIAGAQTNSSSFTFNGPTTLSANVTATALTIGGNLVVGEAATPTLAAGSGAITVSGTSDGTNGGAVETLTVNTTGAITFTGAVGTGDADMLTALTITNSAALTFSGAVNITGAFSQTNAATGTTGFSSTLAAGSATFNGTTINLGGTTTIGGDLNIAAGTLDVTAGNFTLNVAGNWTNSAGASGFNARSGTVTFDGAAAQTITPGGSSFYNLISNKTGTGTNDDLTLAGDTSITNDLTLTDGEFKPVTFTVTLGGNLSVANISGITYLTSTFIFDGVDKTISGTITALNFYNVTVNTGKSVTDNISGTAWGTTFTVNGTFTVGDGKTVTFNKTNYTLAIGDGGLLQGVDVADSKFILKSDLTPTITLTGTGNFGSNLYLQFYFNGDAGSNYSLPSLNYQAGKVEVYGYIRTGSYTVTPTAGTLDIDGDFSLVADRSMEAGTLDFNNSLNTAINIGGSFTRTETYDEEAGWSTVKYTKGTTDTVTFDGATGTQTFDPGASSTFNNITHSGAGTLQLVTTDLHMDGTFLNSAGTFDANNRNMAFSGDWSNTSAAIFTRGSGTMTFDNTTSLTNSSSAAGDLGALAISGSVTLGSSATITSCSGAGTLNLGTGSYTLTISGTTSPLGVTTFNKGTGSTVKYTGVSATNVATVAYHSLQLSGATTYSLAGDLTSGNALTGNITIDNGATLSTSGSNYNIALAGNWINSAGASGFTPGTGTVTLNGTNQSLTGSTTFYNLSKTDTTNDSTDVILTFDNTATQTIAIGGLLTLQGIDDNDRVNLVSDSPGTRWELTANGTFAINWADTTDSDASGNLPITFTNTLGAAQNNLNWSFNTAPTLTSIADSPDPIRGGSTITVAPTGQGDAESSALYYYCAETTAPTSGTTLCSQANGSYASPYSAMTCTYAVTTGDATRTVYCRTYDGTDYSTERTTTYLVDTTAPVVGVTTLSGFTTYSTYIKGTGTVVGGTATDSGSGIDNTTCEYTTNNGGAWSAGTWSTDHCVKSDLTISNGTSYTFNTRVKDLAVNQGTGTATSAYTGDIIAPSTTDNSDTNWHADNQTITLSPTDAGSGVATTYYCVDTDNSCTPTTEGASVSVTCAADSVCQKYVRYYSVDNLANVETVNTSNLIKIDKAAPSTVADAGAYTFGQTSSSAVAVTLVCADGSGSGCLATLYCTDTLNTCSPATSYTTAISISTEGTSYIRYSSTDAQSNAETTASQTIVISSVPATPAPPSGGTGVSYNIPPSPTPTLIPALSPSPTPDAGILDQLAQQLNGLALRIKNIGDVFNQNQNAGQSEIQYPPIEEAVPEEAPTALQGLNIMSVNPLGKFNLSPIQSTVSFFTDKFPQLKKTLDTLSINVNNSEDIKKLSLAELYLPGLTQTISPASLQANPFAAVQGVPLAKLSAETIKKMPSDIVFAKTAGELIDFSSALNIDKQGNAVQRITTISGKPIELVIKTDNPASRVTGLITLKSLAKAGELQPKNIISRLFSAALSTVANPVPTTQSASAVGLLVQKFAYTEIQPGVFKAEITAPTAEGEYGVATIVEYEDQSLTPSESNLIMIVDPEGYVYRQISDGKLRIQNAEVSIYWLNPDTKKYELWPAEKFLQKNPILTNDTGKYSFMVPQGEYYLTARASDYYDYKSDEFSIKVDNGVRMDIELKKKTLLPEWFNWSAVIALLLFLVVVLLVVMFVVFLKGRK